MKITANFMKNVPLEKREVVQKKLKDFSILIPKKKILSDLPKGFWIRKVVGTNIYKFRVNSGDRILFRYDEQGDIVFLSFQSHDDQIRVAKGNRQFDKVHDFQIDETSFEQEEIDHSIDLYIQQELIQHLQEIKEYEVFDDEYIELAIIENTNEFVFTLDQFECIQQYAQPVLIIGCAGSGKTSIALRRAILNSKLHAETVYITKSDYLIEKINNSVPETVLHHVNFQALDSHLKNEVGYESRIVNYGDFQEWLIVSDLLQDLAGFSVRELWIEINTIIKGYHSDSIMMTRDEYLKCSHSNYNEKTKRHLYLFASKYQFWLQRNRLYDFNDLAYHALQKENIQTFTYIICDEIQELTKKQLTYLLKLSRHPAGLVMLGDTSQCTDNYHFDVNFLKQALYTSDYQLKEFYINKNYRSTEPTIHILNLLKQLKNELFKEPHNVPDIAVRAGNMPTLLRWNDRYMNILLKAQEDVNATIIVADQYEKKTLKEMGIKRIFTIEETRGLEYKQVYLYNILTVFKNVWQRLFQEEDSVDLYVTYLNLLYLALTRSKQDVILFEEEATILEQKIRSYVNFETEIESKFTVSNKIQWLQEADKLFRLNKYEQAADAYEKAGVIEKVNLCKRLMSHAHLTQLEDVFNTYMHIKLDRCTLYHLEALLKALEKAKGYSIKGNVRMKIHYKIGSGARMSEVFISSYATNKEAAELLYDALSEKVLVKNDLLWEVTLFDKDTPIQLGQKGLKIDIENNKIKLASINSAYIVEQFNIQDLLQKHFESHRSVIKGNYGYAFVETEKEQAQKQSSKQILNSIFKK
ncbi:UvrD-helicase domain-containing protein [Peribacillus sp. Hz7]|uniref:UvrD-helicase domain-containing protein n=1 Tax=Peribacillus sp. Hz7 TaxID=3344873 RepID=UPI0035CAA42C